MKTFAFIWNSIMKTLGTIGWILVECVVIYVFYMVLYEMGYVFFANTFAIVAIMAIFLQLFFGVIREIVKPIISYIKSLF